MLKKLALLVAALVALAIALVIALGSYAFEADQARFRAARNPCERACIQDSGGLEGCRADCASHPLTYGPAVSISAAVPTPASPAK